MTRAPSPPSECAQCSAKISPQAHACPDCGADERTGWRETSIYDGIDLPDSDRSRTYPKRPLAWYWIITLVAVLLFILLSAFGLR